MFIFSIDSCWMNWIWCMWAFGICSRHVHSSFGFQTFLTCKIGKNPESRKIYIPSNTLNSFWLVKCSTQREQIPLIMYSNGRGRLMLLIISDWEMFCLFFKVLLLIFFWMWVDFLLAVSELSEWLEGAHRFA